MGEGSVMSVWTRITGWWRARQPVKGFIVVLALVSADPALACHRFHVWRYPTPQRCGIIIAQAAHPASRLATVGEERVNVEITITPELLETWAREDAIERLKEQAK
jgi:hypothetical protein